jgi:hypothetical protein
MKPHLTQASAFACLCPHSGHKVKLSNGGMATDFPVLSWLVTDSSSRTFTLPPADWTASAHSLASLRVNPFLKGTDGLAMMLSISNAENPRLVIF